ncbi:MAG: type 4a pilus biogenesis protein PilO [Deltaproteobacteria bacterium]|nr:type 4a pilus biogenesis protein PilO [Deltaproteobacteria bacterium]
MKKTDRICLVIVVIVSLICGYLAAMSVVKQERRIRQENDLISKKSTDLNLAEMSFHEFKKAWNDKRKELETLNERIPETAQLGKFLKQLDSLIKKRNIALISLKPLPTVKEIRYTRIPIHLMFKGAFADIYHLLYDFETMNRVLVMKKMIISKPDRDKLCRVDLTISVFERSGTIMEKMLRDII